MNNSKKPFSVLDFFNDSPWFNIPIDRQAVMVPPLYPKGGLMGGSSDGAPKMSKIQALAAARKKMAQEQKASHSHEVDKPMAGLSLEENVKPSDFTQASSSKPSSRGFPLRKRKDSNPHEKAPPPVEKPRPIDIVEATVEEAPIDLAEPSAFANTMFSTSGRQPPPSTNYLTHPYLAAAASFSANPFAGPSPDDVVIAAQSKGSPNRPTKKG
jgi:elongation factor 1 alpha-like protein